jgi:adiponectin receptor
MSGRSFHIIANHSETIAARGNQLDYIGVVILMWGSTIPSVYYGFYCDLKLQKLYWSVVSSPLFFVSPPAFLHHLGIKVMEAHTLRIQVTALAAACIITTLNPRFRHPQLRPYRAAMYSGLGLSAIIFIIHGIVIHGWEIQNRRMSLTWMALMGALNLMGAAAYAARVGCSIFLSLRMLMSFRFRRDGIPEGTIYLVAAIRYFISWLSSLG